MSISVNDMSRRELEKLKKQIDTQLSHVTAQDKRKALSAAKKAAGSLGFTLGELIDAPAPMAKKSKKSSSMPKKPSIPKYAHPENPAMTWTGKGRQPVWFKEAVEAGKPAEAMLIK